MLERSIRELDFGVGGVCTFLMIVDLENALGLDKKEMRSFCDQLHQLLQDNYPEFVEKQVFVNVPRWYLVFHSIICPCLSNEMKRKFIFGGPSSTVDTLLKYISPETLPIQFGGLNSAHPCTRNPEFTADDAATEVMLKPFSKQTVEIILDQINLQDYNILWELRRLEWGVTYSSKVHPAIAGGYSTIIHKPKKMVISDDAVVSCYGFRVNEPGKLELIIDNHTYKSKRLMYRFKVRPVQD